DMALVVLKRKKALRKECLVWIIFYLFENWGARRTLLLRNGPIIILSVRSASHTAHDDMALVVLKRKKALHKECLV
ncbi:MAG: hypothetical protein PUA67_07280, partial [Ruminococcus sp.]|nr:hypothetical protein [Ruminococcus sp.]